MAIPISAAAYLVVWQLVLARYAKLNSSLPLFALNGPSISYFEI